MKYNNFLLALLLCAFVGIMPSMAVDVTFTTDEGVEQIGRASCRERV